MRASIVLLLLTLAACPSSGVDRGGASADETDNGGGGDSGSGSQGSSPGPTCTLASDCAAAGPKCCDCPTHALSATDPAQLACADVDCGPMSCGSPTEAACIDNHCELVCSAVACDPSVRCDAGYATDANGCLTCSCAGAADLGGQCTGDADCARVRDDCCGCANGGYDTAVPAAEAAAHDAALQCSADPTCPGGNTCAPDLAARCVEGTCALVAGPLPAGACGRADLPACPAGQFCYVNANDQATMHGVGVCQP